MNNGLVNSYDRQTDLLSPTYFFQSKVVRAKERIDQELRLEQNVQGEESHKGQEKG